jgi:hypothetical protein
VAGPRGRARNRKRPGVAAGATAKHGSDKIGRALPHCALSIVEMLDSRSRGSRIVPRKRLELASLVLRPYSVARGFCRRGVPVTCEWVARIRPHYLKESEVERVRWEAASRSRYHSAAVWVRVRCLSRDVGTSRSTRPNRLDIKIFGSIRWSGNSRGLADRRSHAGFYCPNAVELLAAWTVYQASIRQHSK